MVDVRNMLVMPRVYQAVQQTGGFFGARLKAIQRHNPVPPNARIIDIGCGPGHIRNFLPENSHYFGFDTDERYIEYARRHHGDNATYYCQIFNAESARKVGPVDVIMMNGLLHHLTDEEAKALLLLSANTLASNGSITTLDGCYTPNQSAFRKKLLDWDRGRHVRTQDGYLALFDGIDLAVEAHVEEKLSRVPYSFICMTARTAKKA